jgi:hypothetical protein
MIRIASGMRVRDFSIVRVRSTSATYPQTEFIEPPTRQDRQEELAFML